MPPDFIGLTLMPWNASVQLSRSVGDVMLSSAITGIGLSRFRIRASFQFARGKGCSDQRNSERSHLVKHRKQPEQFPAAVAVDIERRVCCSDGVP